MKFQNLFFITLLFIASCGTMESSQVAPTLDTKKVWSGYQTKEETLFEKTLRKAKSGDDIAQLKIGLMYLFGEGVSQNQSSAKEWFRKSAIQGNSEANFNMGAMYFNNSNINASSEDKKNAIFWYTRAAEKGHLRAMNNLALTLIMNNKIKDALLWLEMSAKKGSGYAAYLLADMYDKGIGVKKSSDKVKYWSKKSLASKESEDLMPYKLQSKELLERNQSFFDKLF